MTAFAIQSSAEHHKGHHKKSCSKHINILKYDENCQISCEISRESLSGKWPRATNCIFGILHVNVFICRGFSGYKKQIRRFFHGNNVVKSWSILGLVKIFPTAHLTKYRKALFRPTPLVRWRLYILNVSLTKCTNQRTKARPTTCLVGQRLLAVVYTLRLFYILQALQLDIFWYVIRIFRGEKNWWSKLGKSRKEAEWSTVDLFLKGDGTWSDWATLLYLPEPWSLLLGAIHNAKVI